MKKFNTLSKWVLILIFVYGCGQEKAAKQASQKVCECLNNAKLDKVKIQACEDVVKEFGDLSNEKFSDLLTKSLSNDCKCDYLNSLSKPLVLMSSGDSQTSIYVDSKTKEKLKVIKIEGHTVVEYSKGSNWQTMETLPSEPPYTVCIFPGSTEHYQLLITSNNISCKNPDGTQQTFLKESGGSSGLAGNLSSSLAPITDGYILKVKENDALFEGRFKVVKTISKGINTYPEIKIFDKTGKPIDDFDLRLETSNDISPLSTGATDYFVQFKKVFNLFNTNLFTLENYIKLIEKYENAHAFVFEIDEYKEEKQAETESSSSSSSSSSSGDIDELFEAYEKYITTYIEVLKKSKSGDSSVALELLNLAKEGNTLSEKINKNKGQMDASHLKKWAEMQQRLIELSKDL